MMPFTGNLEGGPKFKKLKIFHKIFIIKQSSICHDSVLS